MSALRTFDPYAFLAGEARPSTPEKRAGLVAPEAETLAALATLAGGQADISISTLDAALVPVQRNPIDIIDISPDRATSPQNEVRALTTAKVAKPAKAFDPEAETLASVSKATASATPAWELADSEAAQVEPNLIAPLPWHQRLDTAASETPFDQPCLSRCGRLERAGAMFLHFCIRCGAWGALGYGVTRDRPGLWYCGKHRPDKNKP
jgi:hypothetical protein